MMFCGKCGSQVDENQLFCPNCGERTHKVEEPVTSKVVSQMQQAEQYQNAVVQPMLASKIQRICGIVMVSLGALMTVTCLDTVEMDWSFLAVCTGILLQVRGILQICKVKMKPIGITTLSLAAILLVFSCGAELDYEWGACAFLVALTYVVIGMLELLKKTYFILGIVQLVGAGVLCVLGLVTFEYIWGEMTLSAGISLVVAGILYVINSKKMGLPQ